jgi:hypothetical protein
MTIGEEAPLLFSWPDDPRWNALFNPIAGVLERAAARLDPRPSVVPPPIGPGEGQFPIPGELLEDVVYAASDAAWRDRAPPEIQALAPDRWRRAAGEVLVPFAASAMPEEPGAPLCWQGARAMEAVDRAAPELGILWQPLADELRGSEAQHAARARWAWFIRWRRSPTWAPPSPDEWLAFGRWLFDPVEGPASGAPVLLPIAAPCAPGPWNAVAYGWRRVLAEPGPAGARLTPSGAAFGPPVFVPAGVRTVTLFGSFESGAAAVLSEPLGPVGTWTLRVGRMDSRFGAARGIDLQLRPDGSAEVILADAFVGPTTGTSASLAAKFGVSGSVVGRWRVSAADADAVTVEIRDIRPQGVTVHPRGRRGFAVPAGPVLGAAEGWIARLSGTRWRVTRTAEGLDVTGSDLGPTIALVLAPAGG